MELTNEETDILKELINIGVGKAAGVLNQITGLHIILHVPALKIIPLSELKQTQNDEDDSNLSAVYLGFEGNFSGKAGLLFPTESASLLVSLLTGEDSLDTDDLDALRVGTLTEIGNIVINGVMGSMGNVLKQHLLYTTPTYLEGTMPELIYSSVDSEEAVFLTAQTRFNVKEKAIQGEIMLTFGIGSFDALVRIINEQLT